MSGNKHLYSHGLILCENRARHDMQVPLECPCVRSRWLSRLQGKNAVLNKQTHSWSVLLPFKCFPLKTLKNSQVSPKGAVESARPEGRVQPLHHTITKSMHLPITQDSLGQSSGYRKPSWIVPPRFPVAKSSNLPQLSVGKSFAEMLYLLSSGPCLNLQVMLVHNKLSLKQYCGPSTCLFWYINCQ